MVWGGLKKFSAYFDLESGSMRSRYIRAEEMAALTGAPVDLLSISGAGDFE